MTADAIARLKITLDDVIPPVLRRIEVPLTIRLDRLHLVLQAAIGWTEAVTLVAGSHVPDEVFASTRALFDDKELVDLTLAIGLINTYNRVAISFRRGPEAGHLA